MGVERQDEAFLRDRLVAAVYERRAEEAERLAEWLRDRLGLAAPGDPDLQVVDSWLAEQRLAAAHRHETRLRERKMALWTGAPLLFALALLALIATVLALSP